MERFVKSVQTTLFVWIVEKLVHAVRVRLNVVAVCVKTTVVDVVVGDGSTKKHRRRFTKKKKKNKVTNTRTESHHVLSPVNCQFCPFVLTILYVAKWQWEMKNKYLMVTLDRLESYKYMNYVTDEDLWFLNTNFDVINAYDK